MFTTELVLVACVAIVGFIVMMSSMRDSVVAELRDTTLAVQNSNQTISYNGIEGSSGSTAGSSWDDALDVDDGEDISGSVLGIDFTVAPTDEGALTLEDEIESRNYRFRMTRFGSTWTGTGDFDNGDFNGSPFWPGTYTIDGTTITVIFDALGGGWNDGQLVLDGSDPDSMSGMITWINSISGFVWEAAYELMSF